MPYRPPKRLNRIKRKRGYTDNAHNSDAVLDMHSSVFEGARYWKKKLALWKRAMRIRQEIGVDGSPEQMALLFDQPCREICPNFRKRQAALKRLFHPLGWGITPGLDGTYVVAIEKWLRMDSPREAKKRAKQKS